jgi:DNA-binding CsgD family transcriptional regulator
MLYDVEALSRDRWCRESIDILKVKYQLGGMAGLPDGGRVGFAVMSTEAEGQATEAAIVSFARLAAQFGQACALGQLVEKRALTQLALLEALSLQLEGVFLLDSCGAPTFVNDAAARVLAASDGLACAGGVLLTRRAAETRKLHAMIGAAIACSSGERESAGRRMLVTRPSAKRPYVIRTMPVPRTDRFLTRTSIACVVHVQDLAAHQAPPAGALRMVFGLTEREAELAVQLTRCAGLEAAAASAGMAVNTARNHLHKIFQKTETSTQAQAVQLLSRIL